MPTGPSQTVINSLYGPGPFSPYGPPPSKPITFPYSPPTIPTDIPAMNASQLRVIIEQNKEIIELLKTLVEKMGHGFD